MREEQVDSGEGAGEILERAQRVRYVMGGASKAEIHVEWKKLRNTDQTIDGKGCVTDSGDIMPVKWKRNGQTEHTEYNCNDTFCGPLFHQT